MGLAEDIELLGGIRRSDYRAYRSVWNSEPIIHGNRKSIPEAASNPDAHENTFVLSGIAVFP